MRTPKKTVIGEVEYCVTEMNPIKATKVLTRLLKLIGKPLAKIVKEAKKEAKDTESKTPGSSILDADLSGDLIGEALEALTERLDENQVEKLIKDLLDQNYITYSDSEDREKFHKLVNADGHFGSIDGGLIGMFSLLKFVLLTNYSDFFGGLAVLKK